MKRFVTASVGLGMIVFATTTGAPAADKCPAELAHAKASLTSESPRGQQEIPVPRGQDIQAPRVSQAAALVREADSACKKGNMALSTKKAREALGLLKN